MKNLKKILRPLRIPEQWVLRHVALARSKETHIQKNKEGKPA